MLITYGIPNLVLTHIISCTIFTFLAHCDILNWRKYYVITKVKNVNKKSWCFFPDKKLYFFHEPNYVHNYLCIVGTWFFILFFVSANSSFQLTSQFLELLSYLSTKLLNEHWSIKDQKTTFNTAFHSGLKYKKVHLGKLQLFASRLKSIGFFNQKV